MYNSFEFGVTTSAQQVPVPSGHSLDQSNFGIQNPEASAGSVYIGGPSVDTTGSSKGWEIAPGQSFSGSVISSSGAPWIIAGASITVTILVNG